MFFSDQQLNQLARKCRQRLHAAYTHLQLADCPFIGQFNGLDPHAARMPAGSRKRHHADTDIGFNHPASRFKVADLNTDFDLLIQIIRGLSQETVNGAGFQHADKIMRQCLTEFNTPALGQLMRFRSDQHQTVFAKRNSFQSFGADITRNNTDLDLALRHSTHDVIRKPFLEIDIHIWMRGQKSGQ